MYQTWHAYFLKPERKHRVKVRESLLSSIPGEGVSCSSETKHSRRTYLFRGAYYGKRGREPCKLCWVRVPVKNICSSETKKGIRTLKSRNCLVWREDYKHKYRNPEELSWVWLPTKIFSVFRKINKMEDRNENRHRLTRRGVTATRSEYLKVPGFDFWRG
jgi:hypothetical protein